MTSTQDILNDPSAIWNQTEPLKSALPWLHELASNSAETNDQHLLADHLPGLLGEWQIDMQANAQKADVMDAIRADHMRGYQGSKRQQTDAKARAKAKGDPA